MQKTKQKLANLVIEKLKEDLAKGDVTLINNLLYYVPQWDMVFHAFGEKDTGKFIKENITK